MEKIIDGKKMADEIMREVKERVATLSTPPGLAVVIVGDDPASKIYVKSKGTMCAEVGIHSETYELPEATTTDELIALIQKLNDDPKIDGILVQMPTPPHIDAEKVLLAISPKKDVDCFHPHNVGLLMIGKAVYRPCTPAGIIEMLKRSGVSVAGKHCVVLGRSNIVGKPMAMMLLQENATVTICHSKTENLADICRGADVIVAAVGKKHFLTADMVKPGAVLIDVGINRGKTKKIYGDIDFDACLEKASLITPVPGGVGLTTKAMLMANCVDAYYANRV